MKSLPYLSRRGFSLIELLVTAVIILTVFGLAIAGYRQFSQKQQLEAAAAQVKNHLRQARAWAMAPRKENCASSTTLSGYEVSFSRASYTVRELCGDPLQSDDVASYSLVNDISFSSPEMVQFSPLNGYSTSDDNITITLEKDSLSRDIVINSNGQIE